jgi:hypothetical protein
MADLILTGQVADKLRDLAERQGRTAEAVVEEMIQQYGPAKAPEESGDNEAPPGSTAAFIKAALAANIRTGERDVASRSREILDNEYPEYLRQRLNRPTVDDESE